MKSKEEIIDTIHSNWYRSEPPYTAKDFMEDVFNAALKYVWERADAIAFPTWRLDKDQYVVDIDKIKQICEVKDGQGR